MARIVASNQTWRDSFGSGEKSQFGIIPLRDRPRIADIRLGPGHTGDISGKTEAGGRFDADTDRDSGNCPGPDGILADQLLGPPHPAAEGRRLARLRPRHRSRGPCRQSGRRRGVLLARYLVDPRRPGPAAAWPPRPGREAGAQPHRRHYPGRHRGLSRQGRVGAGAALGRRHRLGDAHWRHHPLYRRPAGHDRPACRAHGLGEARS